MRLVRTASLDCQDSLVQMALMRSTATVQIDPRREVLLEAGAQTYMAYQKRLQLSREQKGTSWVEQLVLDQLVELLEPTLKLVQHT